MQSPFPGDDLDLLGVGVHYDHGWQYATRGQCRCFMNGILPQTECMYL